MVDNLTGVDGAGVYVARSDSVSLSNNFVAGNGAQGIGGGIRLFSCSDALIVDSVVSNNSAGTTGGGLRISSFDGLFLVNNRVCHNSATDGGGICFKNFTNIVMQANRIHGNSASGNGGAIYFTGQANGVALSTTAADPTVITGNSGPWAVYNDCPFQGGTEPTDLGNVDARNVCWGTTNESAISGQIYDFFDNAGKGLVVFDPIVPSYALSLVTYGWGSVSNDPPGTEYPPMDVVQLWASPSNYWYFAGWGNAITGSDPYTNITMDGDKTVEAYFAPYLAESNTPYWWLASFGLTNFDTHATNDVDGDGMLTWQEWRADTDPTNELSLLAITNIIIDPAGMKISWQGGEQATQMLEHSDSLVNTNWESVFIRFPPTPEGNYYVDSDATNTIGFYRIRAGR